MLGKTHLETNVINVCFSSPTHPDRPWGRPSLVLKWTGTVRSVHLAPRPRTCGASLSFPYIPSISLRNFLNIFTLQPTKFTTRSKQNCYWQGKAKVRPRKNYPIASITITQIAPEPNSTVTAKRRPRTGLLTLKYYVAKHCSHTHLEWLKTRVSIFPKYEVDTELTNSFATPDLCHLEQQCGHLKVTQLWRQSPHVSSGIFRTNWGHSTFTSRENINA
jgi:hypothetical protein